MASAIRYRALIADDNTRVVGWLEEAFSGGGREVTTVGRGDAVVDPARRELLEGRPAGAPTR